MASINISNVLRLAQDTTRLASVAQALSVTIGVQAEYEVCRKELDDALSDLADAMGFELVPVERRRRPSLQVIMASVSAARAEADAAMGGVE